MKKYCGKSIVTTVPWVLPRVRSRRISSRSGHLQEHNWGLPGFLSISIMNGYWILPNYFASIDLFMILLP